MRCLNGEGIKKDRELGIKWMRAAAVKGQFFAFDELRKLTGGK